MNQNTQILKIKRITKLPTQQRVYDLSVNDTHNFFVGKTQTLTSNCDGMSGDAQKALRSTMEDYTGTTRFILTCNYLYKIVKPLQSRCKVINLTPPLEGIISRVAHILKAEGIKVPATEQSRLLDFIRSKYPDIRKIINELQGYSHSGTLQIKEVQAKGIAEKVLQMLKEQKKLEAVRQYVIEREIDFSNDYQQLLKEMFEAVHLEPAGEVKLKMLLQLSDSLFQDNLVIDKEINFYSCCIKLALLLR